MNYIEDAKKLKFIIREMNNLLNVRPVILNKCSPKYVSIMGYYGSSYETKGVESEIVRLYRDVKSEKTFAISFIKDEKRELLVKLSVEKTLSFIPGDERNVEDTRDKEHTEGLILNYSEFKDSMRVLINEMREDDSKRRVKQLIIHFNMSEVLL